MVTKTLTITENAYHLLLQNKLKDESFSQEIQRLLSPHKSRNLMGYFGLLTDRETKRIKKDLKKIQGFNIRRLREQINESS